MNRKMVFRTVGHLLLMESVLMLLPLAVSLIYNEACVWAFIKTIVITLVAGALLVIVFRPKNRIIYAKEGFVIVSLTWLALSAFGSLPFVFAQEEIKTFADAFFETVSGFTTTGASILNNVDSMSRGLLFWRSFTHWVGGMGVLVFMVAIIPDLSDRSIHLMRAEVPGPIVGKLLPRLKDTAKILYLIYIAITLVEIAFLSFGDMDFFEAVVHSFGTAGTGGFGIRGTSIGEYSHYSQWVITIFMLLFGVNFNLFYLILLRKFRSVLKSAELWCYAAIVIVSSVLIAINIAPIYNNVSDTVRTSAFQVASMVTTTGYSTVDFNLWPEFSRALITILLFTGACAGSTAGGLKISRIMILFKMVKNELKHMLHPRTVSVVRFEGKALDKAVQHSVANYFVLYMGLIFIMFLVISALNPFGIETNFTAVVSCFNNVGPGLGMVGPASSYSAYSTLSKYILSIGMLFGRLEIFPLLLTLSPSVWTKK